MGTRVERFRAWWRRVRRPRVNSFVRVLDNGGYHLAFVIDYTDDGKGFRARLLGSHLPIVRELADEGFTWIRGAGRIEGRRIG